MVHASAKSSFQDIKVVAWVSVALFVGMQFLGIQARAPSSRVLLQASGPQATDASSSQPLKIAQFGASIFLGGPWDYEIDQSTGTSRCLDMVDRVVSYENILYVQFIPTLYWVDTGPLQPYPEGFDPSCRGADLSTYYCYSRFNATEVDHWCFVREDGSCAEISESQLKSFIDNVGSCMKYAASKGLNLAVNARVDDGKALGGWRNTLKFDPTQKYGNYSYEEIILNPLADMLSEAATAGSQVEFTLQGEMGATVFSYPNQWIDVVNRIRSRIVSSRATDSRAGPVLVGLGANNLKACGCEYVGIVDAYKYLDALNATFDASKYPDLPAVKQLYKTADFIGISAYTPMPTPQFKTCDFEGLLERMDIELGFYDMSLKEITDAGTEVHFGEFGVGGGTSQNGDVPARTAREAAYTPFFGMGGQYTCAKDPFQMCSTEQPNEVRDYRRYFYQKSSEYFKQGGCEYQGVKRAYIWGTGSWDVLAIYPGDRSEEGSWTDPVVVDIINCHNAVAQGKEVDDEKCNSV